ncbi:MAG: hypothetical protein P8M06_05805 [Pelagibacterales bacterium]|nr:hypothetical protein [Pelagibacterales bacterium]
MLLTALFGVFTFRTLFAPKGMASEFNMDNSSVYIIRIFGTFIASFFLIGIYMIFRPNGPEGAWVYYNLIFIIGVLMFIYDLLFYLKKIDTDTGAKNSITDLGINIFTLISSIILILGLSDKIYI